MSNPTRTALANAATIPEVTKVAEFMRQSLKPGDGFVRLAQRRRDDSGFGYVQDWEVWLALPADAVAAEVWLDSNTDALADAINAVMVLTTVSPAELVIGTSTVNGVIFAGSISA